MIPVPIHINQLKNLKKQDKLSCFIDKISTFVPELVHIK